MESRGWAVRPMQVCQSNGDCYKIPTEKTDREMCQTFLKDHFLILTAQHRGNKWVSVLRSQILR